MILLRFKQYRQSIRSIFNASQHEQGIRFLVLGGLVGTMAGLIAILFHHAIMQVTHFLYQIEPSQRFWEKSGEIHPITLFLVMAAIALTVQWLTQKLAPEAKGHGVPEVMLAVATKNAKIRPRVALVKLLGSALSIGGGFAVGREGPTALIGASFGSVAGQLLKFSRKRMKMIVGCGTAGALAAAFNAPLAGAAFSCELVVGNFSLHYFGPILVAAVMGTLMTRIIDGNYHALFADVSFGIASPSDFVLVLILGILAGLLGILFTNTLYKLEDFAEAQRARSYSLTIGLCFLVALCVVFCPMVAGPAGWDAIRYLVHAEPSWSLAGLAIVLAFLKLLSTSLSLAAGASGGIFAPSLLIGASLGTAYGVVINKILPFRLQSPACYALVGTGAFVAAITQAPLTAMTMIFELTGQYEIILPLILALGSAMAVYSHGIKGSIYTLKLLRRGINLEWGRDVGVLQSLHVAEITDRHPDHLQSEDLYPEALQKFKASQKTTLPVVNDQGWLVGVFSADQLEDLRKSYEVKKNAKVEQHLAPELFYVASSDNLYDAFRLISMGDFNELPVVDSKAKPRLVGVLQRQRLLQAYRHALEFQGVMEKP